MAEAGVGHEQHRDLSRTDPEGAAAPLTWAALRDHVPQARQRPLPHPGRLRRQPLQRVRHGGRRFPDVRQALRALIRPIGGADLRF